MTNNAVWSRTAYPTATDFVFSEDRLTASNNGSGNFVVTSMSINTGLTCYALEYPASGNFNGGFFTLASITGGGPYVGIWVTLAGILYYGNGGGYYATGITIAAGSPGDQILFFIDWGVGTHTSGTKQIWVAPVHAGTVGEWNGSPTANPLTATGGYPITWTMASFVPAVWFYASLAGTMTLISNAAALPGGQSPGNYLGLPVTVADQILAISSVTAVAGANSATSWTCSNGSATGPITYSLDGGTETAPISGTVSGTGGTLFFPTPSGSGGHSVAIQDSSYTQDTSAAFYFGAGPNGLNILNLVQNPAPLSGMAGPFDFTQAVDTLKFTVSLDFLHGGATDGVGTTVNFLDANGTPLFLVSFLMQAEGVSYTGTLNNEFSGEDTPPISGTGGSAWLTGAATITQAGSLTTGSMSFEASDGTTYSSNSFTFQNNAATGGGTAVAIETTAYSTIDVAAVVIVQVADGAAETLSITSASAVAGGTLTIGGAYANAALQYVNISDDDGVSFALGADTSITGSTSGSYQTSSSYTLSAGSYTLYTQDAVTGVLSNPWDLTIGTTGDAFAILNCVMS